MKFFTVYEIINSILLSSVSGIIFGCIYSASESILIFLKEIVFIFPNAIRLFPFLSQKAIWKNAVARKKIKLSFVGRNIFEAFLFSFFGIAMILISYIALDGYIRLYIFLLAAIFFFLSHKYVGKKFSAVFDRVFGVIYFITSFLISIILFPLYKAAIKFIPPIRKAFSPLLKAVRRKRCERLLKNKLNEIKSIMRGNT